LPPLQQVHAPTHLSCVSSAGSNYTTSQARLSRA